MLHYERASADGYSSPLLPGVHASADAQRLAQEVAFSAGRLALLREHPPGAYGEARALGDAEAAARACFLIAYLSPAQGEDPFAAIRAAIADPARELAELDREQLGPRSSYDAARGAQTLEAYERMLEQAGGARAAFVGDPRRDQPRAASGGAGAGDGARAGGAGARAVELLLAPARDAGLPRGHAR